MIRVRIARALGSTPREEGAEMVIGRCVTNTFLKEEVGCCTRDEGGPLEASGQARPQTPASCDRQERWW